MALYMDTGQPVRVNKTAWRVMVVDEDGSEEAFYFQSEEAARCFAQELTDGAIEEGDEC